MKKTATFIAALALTGCATITTGTEQAVYVDTPEMTGAKCKLTDSKNASWNVSESPASVTVTKGNGPMRVACSKQGYKSADVTVEEEFAGATLGNVLLGGGIGVIVDASSGAAQRYPDKVVVWLEPVSFTSSAERAEWEAKKAAYDAERKKVAEEKQKMLDQKGPAAKH